MKMLNHQQCNEFLVAYSNIANMKNKLDLLQPLAIEDVGNYYQPLITIYEKLIANEVSLDTFQRLVALSKSFYYDALLELGFKKLNKHNYPFTTTGQEFCEDFPDTAIYTSNPAKIIKTFLTLCLPFLKTGKKDPTMTVFLLKSLFWLLNSYLLKLTDIFEEEFKEEEEYYQKLFWMWNKINQVLSKEVAKKGGK